MQSVKRIIELDILRIIAVFAVVMIHTAAPYVIKYTPGSTQFLIGNIFDSIARIGVPFFLFISGALMLDEKKVLPVEKLKSKVIKLLIIFFSWSFLYAICFNQANFWHAFIYGHYHMWYLNLIIGLYLITPVLKLFVKTENTKYIYYLIILSLIFLFIPKCLDGLFSHHNAISAFTNIFGIGGFCSAFVAYYIFGWALNQQPMKIRSGWGVFAVFITSVILIFLFTQLRTTPDFKSYDYFYANANILVFIYSTSAFILIYGLIKKLKEKFNETIKKIITKLSNLTFGVYLIHVAVLFYVRMFLKSASIEFGMVELLLAYCSTVILSFLICFILSKIKFAKELIKI